MGAMMSFMFSGGPVFIVHMMMGYFIGILSIVLLVLSLLSGRAAMMSFGAAGLAEVVFAGTNGLAFMFSGFQNNTNSNLNSIVGLTKGLTSVADGYAPYLFAIGMIAAAFLALVVISLASAWAVTEATGLGRNRFFWIYLLESLPAVAVPMFFPNLFSLLLNSMVAFTFVLIGPGIILGLIASNRKIMGANVSSTRLKVSYWASLAMIVGFGIFALLTMF